VAPVIDDLAWYRPDRYGISDYERRRSRELLAPGERCLLDARGRDSDGPVFWVVTARRLLVVTHERFDENVQAIRLSSIVHVDRQRSWTGWMVQVAADGRRWVLDGVDAERATTLAAELRARAGLRGD
jgi:hypothetical protein